MSPRVSISALAFVLLGCLPYSPVEHAKPPLEVPDQFKQEKAAKNAGQRWWEGFGDPQLTQLVEQALTGNFDVMVAWSRLERAQAVATAAGAPLWPSLGAFASAGQSVPFPGANFESITLGAQASYEIDLFGRNITAAEVAGLEAINERDLVEVAAITVSAETTQAYFNRIYAARRVAVLQQQLDTNNEYLDLIQLRFEKGLTSALDVYQQTDRTIATEQALLTAKLDEQTATYALAQLLGRAPMNLPSITLPEDLPAPPALPESGLSTNILINRPDVRAARRTVTIADQRVGLAIAEYFPRINLSGRLFFQSDSFDGTFVSETDPASGQPLGTDSMFEALLRAFSVDLQQTIFDGFNREAQVDQRQATLRESFMNFGRTVLGAIVEVETALATEKNQRELLTVVEKRLEQNAKTLREARARYERGLSDFLPVLTAQTTAQGAEIALLDAKRALLLSRVQLHRALGGTWTRKLVQPTWVEPENGDKPQVPPIEDRKASQ